MVPCIVKQMIKQSIPTATYPQLLSHSYPLLDMLKILMNSLTFLLNIESNLSTLSHWTLMLTNRAAVQLNWQ